MIEHCNADEGHLFLVHDTRLQCAASVGQIITSTGLENFVQSVHTRDAQLSEGVTATHLGMDNNVATWGRWTSDTGAIYDPVPLHGLDMDGELLAVGIAILRPRAETLSQPTPEFLGALVRALTETGDLPSTSPPPT